MNSQYSIVINSQKDILSKQIVIGYKVTYRYKQTYVVGVPTLSKALYNREPKKATSSWKNKHHTLQHNKVVSRIWHPKKKRSNVPFVMKTGIIFQNLYTQGSRKGAEQILCFNVPFLFIKWKVFFKLKGAFYKI